MIMKIKLEKTILFIIMFSIVHSCTEHHKKLNNVMKINAMKKNYVVLIKTIPGGSRAHIISFTPDGTIKYKVGAIEKLGSDLGKIEIDKSFGEKTIFLNNKDLIKINNLISLAKSSSYFDQQIVKDNMQFYIYIGGKKKFFGYEKNFNKFPKEWKDVLNFLLNTVGKPHKIAGTS